MQRKVSKYKLATGAQRFLCEASTKIISELANLRPAFSEGCFLPVSEGIYLHKALFLFYIFMRTCVFQPQRLFSFSFFLGLLQ